jgi:D-amino peptidase
MQVYISADMEGTAGVTGWTMTEPGQQDYEIARRLMVGEVNAAIEGAFAGGATTVVVNDSHDGMRNMPLDEIDARALVLSGAPKPGSMVEALTGSYDLMFCTGYHAMAGSPSTLAHTYNLTVQQAELSGRKVGELGLNAYWAGTFGVRVALVTGDDVLEAEAQGIVPWARYAQVKEARGRYGSLSRSAQAARAAIRQAAEMAVREHQQMKPLLPPAEPEIRLRFTNPGQAQTAALCPGADRLDALTVVYAHPDYRQVYRAFRTMVTLASGQN